MIMQRMKWKWGFFYMCTKYNWSANKFSMSYNIFINRVLCCVTIRPFVIVLFIYLFFFADAERYEFAKQVITISYRYYRQWNPP